MNTYDLKPNSEKRAIIQVHNYYLDQMAQLTHKKPFALLTSGERLDVEDLVAERNE